MAFQRVCMSCPGDEVPGRETCLGLRLRWLGCYIAHPYIIGYAEYLKGSMARGLEQVLS